MKCRSIFLFSITYTALAIDTQQVSIVHRYMVATYYQSGNKADEANRWYNLLFSLNAPVYTYKGYIQFLFEQQQFSTITKLMTTMQETFKHDPVVQRLFALSLNHLQEHEKAAEYFINLNQQFKNDAEIALYTAQVYLNRKEPHNALIVIDSLLSQSPRRPNDFLFYFIKAQIYASLSQLDNARIAIEKSLSLHANFDKGWLFFALLNEHTHNIESAINCYNRFLSCSCKPNLHIKKRIIELSLQQESKQKETSVVKKE